jgi:hypothetical protein
MFECYYKELVGYFTRTLGDSEAAKDVVQETYLRISTMKNRRPKHGSVVWCGYWQNCRLSGYSNLSHKPKQALKTTFSACFLLDSTGLAQILLWL